MEWSRYSVTVSQTNLRINCQCEKFCLFLHFYLNTASAWAHAPRAYTQIWCAYTRANLTTYLNLWRKIITCFSISIARTFNTLKYSLVHGATYLSGVKSVQLEKGITKRHTQNTKNQQPKLDWQNGTPLKQINARTQILTEYTNS